MKLKILMHKLWIRYIRAKNSVKLRIVHLPSSSDVLFSLYPLHHIFTHLSYIWPHQKLKNNFSPKHVWRFRSSWRVHFSKNFSIRAILGLATGLQNFKKIFNSKWFKIFEKKSSIYNIDTLWSICQDRRAERATSNVFFKLCIYIFFISKVHIK